MVQSVRELWRYRELGKALVSKEIKLRYRRSVLGVAWTMLNPLMTMAILTVVFSHAMRIEIDRFPVFVLCMLLPWNFFSQSLSGGGLSIIHNEALLRNIRVPRAIFPVALVSSHLVNFLLALVPLVLVMAWQRVPPSPAVVALPWFLLTLWMFTIGVTLALSAWTVFFRDLTQIIEVSLTAFFYLTPVIYPLTLVPEEYRRFLLLNPVLHLATPFRTILFEGQFPDAFAFLLAGTLAFLALGFGLAIFRRREHLFLHYLS